MAREQVTRINLADVRAALRRKRYAFHSAPGVALTLTVPDNESAPFEGGRKRRTLLKGLTDAMLTRILTHSETTEEAVKHVEDYSLGRVTQIQFASAPSGLTMEQIANLIDNKVAPVEAKIAERDRRIAELEAELETRGPAKKAAKKSSRPSVDQALGN